MDLSSFLTYALTAGGCGAIVFAVIEAWDKLGALSGSQKFALSLVLSVAVPALAYGSEIALGLAQLTPEGVFGVLAVAWVCSQGLHKVTEVGK